ncbi:MAG: hypothetical protein ACR2JH_02445 [Solirubrobacteraceae bacterium]
MLAGLMIIAAPAFACSGGTLAISSTSASPGKTLRLAGNNFAAGAPVLVRISSAVQGGRGVLVTKAMPTADGQIVARLTVPRLRPGEYTVVASQPRRGYSVPPISALIEVSASRAVAAGPPAGPTVGPSGSAAATSAGVRGATRGAGLSAPLIALLALAALGATGLLVRMLRRRRGFVRARMEVAELEQLLSGGPPAEGEAVELAGSGSAQGR